MLERLLDAIRAEVSTSTSLGYLTEVYLRDRWSTFAKYHETCEYCRRVLEENGLVDVELVEVPADGRTRFGDWVMPLAWDAGEATLEIAEPQVPCVSRVLARRLEVPNALVMWSSPTPPEGVEAEVLALEQGTPEECEGLALEGKIVFTPRDPRQVKGVVARKHGLGVVSDYVRNQALREATFWVNGWGDKPGSWMMTAQDSRLWGFSLSPARGAYLRGLLKAHGRIVLRAKVDSRLYEGTLPYVTGLIPGSTLPDEEVLILGHLYEQGANDNAAGAAVILEISRVFNALFESRALARAKRSIRFLLMAECYGSMPYVVQNRERLSRTLAAVNVDLGAGRYELARSAMELVLSPHCHRSFVDALMLKIIELYHSKYAAWRHWAALKYTGGTDNYLYDPSIGVPSPWVYMGMGDDYWHTSEDSLDKVDPRSLRDLATVDAAFLYFIAKAGFGESLWLSEEALALGMRNIADCSKALLQQAFASRDGMELGRLTHEGIQRIEHFATVEARGLASVKRLVNRGSRAALSSHLEDLNRRLTDFAQAEKQGFVTALSLWAEDAGVKPEPWLREETPWQKEADRVIPRRRVVGTVTLDGIPYEEWEVVKRSPRWWGVETAALWWADGQRTVREIHGLVRQEFDEVKIDLLHYFRFLAKQGYVAIC